MWRIVTPFAQELDIRGVQVVMDNNEIVWMSKENAEKCVEAVNFVEHMAYLKGGTWMIKLITEDPVGSVQWMHNITTVINDEIY